MKILKWVLYIVLGLVVLVLAVASVLPKSLRIVSETEINLPVNRVFYSLATFTDRASWDPWVEKDSTTQLSIENREGYTGTKYSWTSKKSGSGMMMIDSLVDGKNIYMSLQFTGMDQKALVWHDMSFADGKTKLTWGFEQKAQFPVGRIIMALMKGSLQKDYDKGLANLKKHLEEHGVKVSRLSEILVEEIPGFYAVAIEGRGTMQDLSSRMGELVGILMNSIQEGGLEVTGTLYNHYKSFDQATGISVFDVGIPVAKPGKVKPPARMVKVESFRALEAIHTGPYNEFGISYGKFMKHISENQVPVNMEAWEFYLSDPAVVTDDMQWKTLIAFPLR